LAISGLAALFVFGALLAGTGIAQTTTTTTPTDALVATDAAAVDTTTEFFTTTEALTTTEITTAPAAAPITTTVERTITHTRRVIVPVTTTPASTSNSSDSTPTWVWVVIGVLAAGIGVLVFVLASRGGHKQSASPVERRQRLDSTVGTWAAQGWAVDSQTGESAVLRRGSELMLVTVDEAGHVNTRPLDPGSHPAP